MFFRFICLTFPSTSIATFIGMHVFSVVLKNPLLGTDAVYFAFARIYCKVLNHRHACDWWLIDNVMSSIVQFYTV